MQNDPAVEQALSAPESSPLASLKDFMEKHADHGGLSYDGRLHCTGNYCSSEEWRFPS